MNADRLLALYDQVAGAPDAVARLRRFVLDLAVRGRLVVQEAGDVSPVKLLVEARKQLRAQAETAKRMRWKQTDPVAGDEIDKEMPPEWVAARVNDTGLYINGLAFKPAEWKQSGIPIIRIQNLTDPQKEFNYAQGDFPDEVMVRDGDLLVSWSATLEAFKWDPTAIHARRPPTPPRTTPHPGQGRCPDGPLRPAGGGPRRRRHHPRPPPRSPAPRGAGARRHSRLVPRRQSTTNTQARSLSGSRSGSQSMAIPIPMDAGT